VKSYKINFKKLKKILKKKKKLFEILNLKNLKFKINNYYKMWNKKNISGFVFCILS
jgi:hypothetical protein